MFCKKRFFISKGKRKSYYCDDCMEKIRKSKEKEAKEEKKEDK
jgi:hypothetical protein